MKKCPYCAEEIQEDAKVCGRCHSDLTVAPPPGQPAQPVTSKKAIASLILIILLVSVTFLSFILLAILDFLPRKISDYIVLWMFAPEGPHLGLISLSLSATILAIIYGHKARRDIRRSAGRLKGAGIALAGKTLGYLFSILFLLSLLSAGDLSKNRQACNPPSVEAVGSLRTLKTSLETYTSTYGGGYAPSLAALDGADNKTPPSAQAAGLIDDVLASGRKHGYLFTYVPGNLDNKGFRGSYTIHADPSDDLFDAPKENPKLYFMDATPLLLSLLASPLSPEQLSREQLHYFTDQTGEESAAQIHASALVWDSRALLHGFGDVRG